MEGVGIWQQPALPILSPSQASVSLPIISLSPVLPSFIPKCHLLDYTCPRLPLPGMTLLAPLGRRFGCSAGWAIQPHHHNNNNKHCLSMLCHGHAIQHICDTLCRCRSCYADGLAIQDYILY